MSKLIKITLCFCLLLAVYLGVGFLWVPEQIRSKAESALAEGLHADVQIAEADFNPLTLEVSLHDISLNGLDAAWSASLAGVSLNFSVTSLIRLEPVLDAVRLTEPQLRFTRSEQAESDNSSLAFRWRAFTEDLSPDRWPVIVVGHLAVNKGQLVFIDQSVDGHFRETVYPVALEHTFLS